MKKENLLNMYHEFQTQADKKHDEIMKVVYNFDELTKNYSSEEIDLMIKKKFDEEEALRKKANSCYKQYSDIIALERKETEKLLGEGIAIKNRLGVDTNDIVITGGVLSKNASESHLIGREKTIDELYQDKELALTEIKIRVRNKELSLNEASELKQEVEHFYDNKINDAMAQEIEPSSPRK